MIARLAALLSLLAFTPDATAQFVCPTPGNVIPHSEAFRFTNNTGRTVDLFALVVAAAGDVNRDRITDIIVYSLEGGGDTLVSVHSGADGEVLFLAEGGPWVGGFGDSPVAAAGDVNRDGFDDVLVGRPFDNQVDVLGGPDGRLLRTLPGLPGSPTGTQGDRFGACVNGAGDVNLDGYEDHIVGAAQVFASRRGYARLYSGVDGRLIDSWFGRFPTSRFGHSVDGAGDVDGDGTPDVVVGSPRDGNEYVNPGFPPFVGPFRAVDTSGSVSVFSGATGERILLDVGTPPDIPDSGAGAGLGWSVCGLGSTDGDPFADFAAATFQSDDLEGDASYARLYRGNPNGGEPVEDKIFSDGVRTEIGAAGDVDGDGRDDVIFGATRLEPLAGPPNVQGGVVICSGATGERLFTEFDACLSSFGSSTIFRRTVDGLGDIDADGLADFVVGLDEGFVGGGTVVVFTSR